MKINARFLGALLVAFLLAPDAADARLGETRPQIERRYGLGFVLEEGRLLVSNKSGIAVEAYLDEDGVCVLISFQAKNLPKLSEDEVNSLMEASGGGKKWTRPEKEHVWITEDETLMAVFVPIDGKLWVLDREKGLDRFNTEISKPRPNRLEGF